MGDSVPTLHWWPLLEHPQLEHVGRGSDFVSVGSGCRAGRAAHPEGLLHPPYPEGATLASVLAPVRAWMLVGDYLCVGSCKADKGGPAVVWSHPKV